MTRLVYAAVDISVLCQYNGRGRCGYVSCTGVRRYRSIVKQWALSIGWKVEETYDNITIIRPKYDNMVCHTLF